MKITIDIDCSPEEARRFLGLPDVTPLQEAFVAELQKRMMSGLKSRDGEALMKLWFPSSFEGWERLQKTLWQQMAAAASPRPQKEKDKK